MATTFKVTFDRIGRKHDVPPLLVPTTNEKTGEPTTNDDVAYLVHTYAGGYLVSSGYTVTCSIDEGLGHIGGGRYGTFKIDEVATP